MLDEKPNRTVTMSGRKAGRSAELLAGPRRSGPSGSAGHSARRLAQELATHTALLQELAARYNWWQKPETAVKFPARVVAQVMNLGSFEDAGRMADALGETCLRAVLEQAEGGQLNARSWHYWHYRLNHAAPDQVPPLPRRRIG